MSDPVLCLPGSGPIVILCEHGSERLPSGWEWPEADQRLVGTHWSHDIGVEALVQALHERTGWPAVVAQFSRLLVDPNRDAGSDELFRTEADGVAVALNQDLDDAEKARRIDSLWRPYHAAAETMVRDNPGASIVSLHSFTDNYEGQARTMEVGVLFDLDEAPALAVHQDFVEAGYRARLNEPWSGKNGLMYSPHRHATNHGRRALEFEFRQDLLVQPAWRAKAAETLAASVRRHLT